MMSTDDLLMLARLHERDNMATAASASFCLSDAYHNLDMGDDAAARRWAIKSLQYSVGILHPDYKRAIQGVE